MGDTDSDTDADSDDDADAKRAAMMTMCSFAVSEVYACPPVDRPSRLCYLMPAMDEPLVIDAAIVIPAEELRFTASRSGGPGGQHVNKTSSRVTLSWNLAGTMALDPQQRARAMRRLASRLTRDGRVIINVDDERSQHRNLEIARERLAVLIRQALAEDRPRRATRVSVAQKRRRLEEKRRNARKKELRREVEG